MMTKHTTRHPAPLASYTVAFLYVAIGAMVAKAEAATLRDQADYLDAMAEQVLTDPRHFTAPWN